MNTSMLIEAIGYLGSALVLVSFLMVSVVKLRIVNTIGSIIFTVYAFIIHSYPTAIMNLCLVMINIYYLIKMSNTGQSTKAYDLVEVTPSDGMLRYTIDRLKSDIEKYFPGINLDFPSADTAYIICHKGSPAGLLIGRKKDSSSIDILLDYALPEYRDFSIGSFLFSVLSDRGVKTFTYSGPSENNKEYLDKNGFVKKGDIYEKNI